MHGIELIDKNDKDWYKPGVWKSNQVSIRSERFHSLKSTGWATKQGLDILVFFGARIADMTSRFASRCDVTTVRNDWLSIK